MTTSADTIAPGPRGHWLLGNLDQFRSDPLALLMQSVQADGDVVRLRLGPHVVHILNHPDHARHVLQSHHHNFDKATRSAAIIKAITGDSLLTANGEFWRHQRRAIQPAFHHHHVEGFARAITTASSALIGKWQARPDTTQPVDIATDMMRLTYAIVARALFNTEAGPDADAIGDAMETILPHAFGRLQRAVNPPLWLPTRANRRFHQAIQSIDEVVFRIIARHHAQADSREATSSFLSLLMLAVDDRTGRGMSDRQLRNEAVTFLLAGHETTANALAWTFHLIATHPDTVRILHDEARSLPAERTPSAAAMHALPHTRMAVMEAMRLFPPVWLIERRVVKQDNIAGYRLPAGSSVVISPYALHRHPAFWANPDAFLPGRFTSPPPPAYLPFGLGPRTCIGREFAMLEAVLITTMIMRAFTPRHPVGYQPTPSPGLTLRPLHGMPMLLQPLP